MHRSVKIVVVAATLLWLLPSVASANDDVTSDGDLTSSATRVLALGEVCPGQGGASGTAEIRITKMNQNFNNSFQNGASVTISVASTAQSGSGANGTIAAALDGPAPVQITMPSDWNPATSPFPASVVGKTTAAVTATISLDVPAAAAPGAYEAAVAFQASGPGYTNNTGTTTGTITDIQGTAASQKVTWTVLAAGSADCNRAPRAHASFSAAHVACPGAGNNATLEISFDDPDLAIPGSGETHEVTVDWGDGSTPTSIDPATSPLSVGHRYAAAGPHEATVVVTDQHGATDSATASVTVDYSVLDGGVRQPINMDGSSVFRAGSTVPVKIRFAACDGSIPTDLAPGISVALASSSPPGSGVNENVASTSAADTGRVMRFSDGQWIYNLATSSLSDPSARYRLTITVPATGQNVQVIFGLRT